MAEGIKWSKPFGFFKIPSGWTVVRQSWLGNISTKDFKIRDEVETLNLNTTTVDLYTCDIGVLDLLLQRNIPQSVITDITNIKNERIAANNANIVLNKSKVVTLNVPSRAQVVKKKIDTKHGVKIRWFWQSILLLPTKNQQVDTATYTNITKDKVKINYDIDYEYRINDPETFANMFNQYWDNMSYEKPYESLIGAISTDMEKFFRPFIISNDLDYIRGITGSDALLNTFRQELDKVGKKYGVEITNLYLKSVELPQDIVEAEAKKRAAEAEAKAKRISAEAEAEAIQKRGEAEADALSRRIDALKAAGMTDDYSIAIALNNVESKQINVRNDGKTK